MKYSIIYMDPPWTYADRKTIRKDGKVAKRGIGASTLYDCISLERLQSLPIFNITAENCALHIWATGPHLEACFQMVAAWNETQKLRRHKFLYKNKAFTWVKKCKIADKPFFGNGYYYKHNAEDCLLFIRGKMKPISDAVPQLIYEPHPRNAQGEIIHSRKPATARERIVQCFGNLSRIELFATEKTLGWNYTGLEVDGVDIFDYLTNFEIQDLVAKNCDQKGEKDK